MSRPHNTLSTTLRRAWDGKTLQIATKTNPILVTGAHISLIGQTTLEDLDRYLGVTDIVNGFVNRGLWGCITRSKFLPFGGKVVAADLERIAKRIRAALKFASTVREVGLSAKAARLWTDKYAELSGDRTGLVGAATSRAEAQTRRIAAIYALLDEREEVCVQHLKAALEVWRFCEQSAQFIFGRRRSVGIGDEILEMLRRAKQKGLSRTEISAAFSRHRNRYQIGTALEQLKKSGDAAFRKVSTDGRAAERWYLADALTGDQIVVKGGRNR